MKRLPMVEDEEPAQKPIRPAGPITIDARIAGRMAAEFMRPYLGSKIKPKDEIWFSAMCMMLATKIGDHYLQSQRLAVGKPAGTA